MCLSYVCVFLCESSITKRESLWTKFAITFLDSNRDDTKIKFKVHKIKSTGNTNLIEWIYC